MATPYLVADSAQVTVLRSLASTAFGKYGLKLPEGVDLEDVYEVAAPGNELAYVSSLGNKRRVGGMFRRFVRADVNITAQGEDMVPASDVERVLDEAAKRVSGDFFLESDITKAGLGPWVPMVDFHVGDIVNVEIWGRVVPLAVTRIEPKRTEHSDNDWSVHVGGQLLSDSEARLAENADIYNAVVSDRRELAGLDGKIRAETANRKSAISAESRRSDAYADAAVSRVEESLVRASRDLSDEIARTVSQADFEEYNGQLQARLWGAQGEFNQITAEFQAQQEKINAQQREIDAAQSKQLELTRQLAEANQKASAANSKALVVEKEYRRRLPRMVFAKHSEYQNIYRDPESFLRLEAYGSGDRGIKVTALGGWTGDMVVRATAIGPLSANSVDSVKVHVTSYNRVFNGVPEAAQMAYNTLDITIYPD